MPDFLTALTIGLPLWALALLIFGGLPLIAILLQALTRRLLPPPRAKAHNDVAGFLVAVIGVIYAVTVGFTIADQWENYTDARDSASREAFTIASVAHAAVVLEPRERRAVEDAVVAYNRAVIDWWPAEGESVPTHSAAETRALEGLFGILDDVRPATEAQRAYVGRATEGLLEVSTLRMHRIHEADKPHLEGPLWITVLIASGVTCLFCMLFGLESPWLHYTMIGGISVIIGVNLFLVVILDYPLVGTLSISPESFRSVVADLT